MIYIHLFAESKNGSAVDIFISEAELQSSSGPEDFFVLHVIKRDTIRISGKYEVEKIEGDGMLPDIFGSGK